MNQVIAELVKQIEQQMEELLTQYNQEWSRGSKSGMLRKNEGLTHAEAETGALFLKIRKTGMAWTYEWRSNRTSYKRFNKNYSKYIKPRAQTGYTVSQLQQFADPWEGELIAEHWPQMKRLQFLRRDLVKYLVGCKSANQSQQTIKEETHAAIQ